MTDTMDRVKQAKRPRVAYISVGTSILCSLLLSACSSSIKPSDLPEQCLGASCEKRSLDSPELRLDFSLGLIPLSFADFELFTLQDAVITRTEQSLRLQIDKHKVVKLSLATSQSFTWPEGHDPFLQSQFDLIDYPRIMFEHTPTDPEPEALSDLYIWRMAMANKGDYYSSELYRLEGEELNIYYGESTLGQLSHLALVSNKQSPDALLKVMGYGLENQQFEQILASLRPLRR